ncbi:MAG: T9SS type A sorting domain-containing protein [Candidatus Marinimicrobia bacterium]|nr:T9SS type A sorting domain-containing protein [Candidatus Neomarinimicrobiota bacterium]
MTLSSAATINGNLILESNLDLNGQTITLSSDATLIEGSGRLSGSTGTITTTRILSDIDENVAGIGAEVTEDGSLGSTTITRGHTAQGSQSIERYYQITTANSASNATLVFHYDDSELNGQTESLLQLYKSSDGDSWAEQTSTVNTTANTLTMEGINSFSYWTAAPTGSDASLPVELTSFTASRKGSAVVLNWVTESEIENLGFILARSENEGAWHELASYKDTPSLSGQGSVSYRTEYNYTDANIANGVEYNYRLADVSYVGDVKYHTLDSKIKDENNTLLPTEMRIHKNYPNPFNPSTMIAWELGSANRVVLAVYDVNGRLIRELVNSYQSPGYHEAIWDGQDAEGNIVPTGLYLYRLSSAQQTQTHKMLMLR